LDTNETAASGRGRSPSLAAALSFLWPGLGQFYLRNRRAAAIFAAPPVVVLALLAYGLRRGPVVFAADLFANRTVGLVTVVVLLLLGAWRLASVALAFRDGAPAGSHRVADKAILAALVAAVVVSHLGGTYYVLAFSNAGAEVFNGNTGLIADESPDSSPPPGPTFEVSPADSGSTATDIPTTTPPPSIDGRVTILFTGFDSTATRIGEKLYDSIMVVSFDPKSNSIQMISVPRDTSAFPLYFGSHQAVPFNSYRINDLPHYVANGWIPTTETGPIRGYLTLRDEIQYLVGIHIDYYAAMDMQTFVAVIDQVGGIWIDNPSVIEDPVYDWLDGSRLGVTINAGMQLLDGRHALAYVRARVGTAAHPDSDYMRSGRQQQVLVALMKQMAQPGRLLAWPGLLSRFASSVDTNFPSDRLADYVDTGDKVPSSNITQIVLSVSAGYSIWPRPSNSSASCLLDYKVAQLSRQLFGKDSLWYGQRDPANTCPTS
jgi:polyisoprenyl-teichoic acid--peptidoglycan teichoic acid transferase